MKLIELLHVRFIQNHQRLHCASLKRPLKRASLSPGPSQTGQDPKHILNQIEVIEAIRIY